MDGTRDFDQVDIDLTAGAPAFAWDCKPASHDISHTGRVYRNMAVSALVEEIVRHGEGELTDSGAIVVRTGKYTGRSPSDKFIDDDEFTHDTVDWGKVNQKFKPDNFDHLLEQIQTYLDSREVYICDAFIGAAPKYRMQVRVVSELAYHSLFARQLFIQPDFDALQNFRPQLTIIDAARFQADPATDGTRTGTFILFDFARRLVLIGGTEYAGEIKKSAFTVMNYLLPGHNVFPMHCSANIGKKGDVALFFGLSGTGKTTLSSDPARRLIGDDEHGWDDDGVFNFEGGCYAKCINLSQEKEPQIWEAIRYGAVLENVVVDPRTRVPDFEDERYTENTRAAYPVSHIPGAVAPSIGPHPKTIVFLTADASGVLPPIARLNGPQAMYHFLSGYTSKLAGTERGVTEPQATFSTCFGAPFMPLPPTRYAKMLGEKLHTHAAACYLVNTGWTGGPYGIGTRMNLQLTRCMIAAALSGELQRAAFRTEPFFGLEIPEHCPGVPTELLDPRSTWPDKVRYDTAARELARLFVANFQRFAEAAPELVAVGPSAS